MSTRSMVAMKIGGKYKAIYVHFDGYIAGVGSTLYCAYQDPKKIKELILKGDRSCLSDEVDDKVYKEQYKIECNSIDELIKEFKDLWTEYLYLYEDNKWKVLYKYDVKEIRDDSHAYKYGYAFKVKIVDDDRRSDHTVKFNLFTNEFDSNKPNVGNIRVTVESDEELLNVVSAPLKKVVELLVKVFKRYGKNDLLAFDGRTITRGWQKWFIKSFRFN